MPPSNHKSHFLNILLNIILPLSTDKLQYRLPLSQRKATQPTQTEVKGQMLLIMSHIVVHDCCQLVARYKFGVIAFHSPLIIGQLVKLLTYLLIYLLPSLLTYLFTNTGEHSPFEKLTGSQLVKKTPRFMEPEDSLPR
jgi:hypothetical protein